MIRIFKIPTLLKLFGFRFREQAQKGTVPKLKLNKAPWIRAMDFHAPELICQARHLKQQLLL